ncbi:hypothetical protein C8R42DRAFT_579935 [Lentinula raphanica]|nr:hypothetical protein C8R42DRAFT_579935 [Lentinula raphanica]
MSRPRLPKHFRETDHTPTPITRESYALIRSRSSSPTKRRKETTREVLLTSGASYTQRFPLPTPRGQVGFQVRPSCDTDLVTTTTPTRQRTDFALSTVAVAPSSPTAAPPPRDTSHQRKRVAQYKRWTEDVIPRLVRVFLNYIAVSRNLAEQPREAIGECVCMNRPRELKVIIVRFHQLEELNLRICSCLPAAVQLMRLGLFGCTPLQPSLAVDLRVLDFVTRLNLRISPNNTAWCSTLQDFLRSQGYHLHTQDPLRRRFGNALQWFNTLQDVATEYVDRTIERARHSINPSPTSSAANNTESRHQHKRVRHDEVESESETQTRPSDYLRRRCPLCFGGRNESTEDLSCIVCLDACFTQKNNARSHRDPERQHPKSVFVPESDVITWQDFVENVRPSGRNSDKSKGEEEEDGYEGSLQVPKSVLDACEESFTAADGAREKASTRFFDSTGLMGLLCRHDRVLWLVNITTPGERRHYALVLVDTLFQHLPTSYTVGLLYDIGCSLERSCVKWGFLKDYLSRISFAISVFHAFGHNWPCQCIYHPRKCKGFGLSDGEGCERFWHSISKLIPYLRVCGHHLRIYSLNAQIQHSDHESLWTLATWIVRKWKIAEEKRLEGEKDVRFSMKNSEFLRGQWAEQVKHQTQPLPKQSRNAAKKAVKEALRLRDVRDALKDRVRRLEEIVTDVDAEPYEVEEARVDLKEQALKLRKADKDLLAKERALGVEGKAEYREVASSPFIAARLNAKAVKVRLREKLKARKFERDRLERSFRRQMSSDCVHAHTADAVKRRDPGIESLARTYNGLCVKLSDMIEAGNAPPHAVAPRTIPTKELFTLDIDDSIWDDIGLANTDDTLQLPPWLADEQVRTGIKGILLRDRCDEELRRLCHEVRVMREWFADEWEALEKAIGRLHETEDDIIYQLHLRRSEMCRLCVVWDRALSTLRLDHELLVPWGPSQNDLATAAAQLDSDYVLNSSREEDEDDGEISDELEDYDGAEFGMLDCLDALDSADVY